MARRRFTIGRALALLILGIGVGAGLFIGRHLRPDALRQQVKDFLSEVLQADFTFDKVVLNVDTGVEVQGLKIYYTPETPALEAERVALRISHQELLSGDVVIREVEVHGLVVRLKRDADREVPSLPGIFRPVEAAVEQPTQRPTIYIRPGRGGSRLELLDAQYLREDVPVRLRCARASLTPNGPVYTLNALFEGERAGKIDLHAVFDPGEAHLAVDGTVTGMHIRRDDKERLSRRIQAKLPPVEAEGRADVAFDLEFSTQPFKPLRVEATASLRGLTGAFGNLHTGDPAGLPFKIRNGEGTLTYVDGRVELNGFQAEFVGSKERAGTLAASLRLDGTEADFRFQGTGIQATTDDLRLLLGPDMSETVVEQYLPAGRFDFTIDLKHRPDRPPKVNARLKMHDGRFTYAGQLDELTGRRFGFRYPLERCEAELTFETDVATPRGTCHVLTMVAMKGHSPIARPREDGPKDVVATAQGTVHMYADDLDREDVRVDITVHDLPIDRKLAAAFASTPRGMPYHAFDLSGWAKEVRIAVRRDGLLEESARATYEVDLEQCRMAYEEFPLHLEDLEGRIVSTEQPRDAQGIERELRFERFQGRAVDGGIVTGEGHVRQRDDGTEDLLLTIRAEDLTIGPDLDAALRKAAGDSAVVDLWDTLKPHGRISAEVRFLSVKDSRITIRLDGKTSLRGYEDIACPVTDLKGRISYEEGLVLIDDVSGRACGAPFHVSGAVQEKGEFRVMGHINQLSLAEPVQKLLESLAPESALLLANLRLAPESTLDVKLKLERTDPGEPVAMEATLQRLDLRSEVRGIPIVVQGGPVEIDGESVSASDLWIKADDADVRVRRLEWPRSLGEGFATLDANNVDAVEHLARLFGPGLGDVLGHNLRADLRGFTIEFSRAARTVILSGAVDLRRHRLLEEAVPALEPTGALGFSPITLQLPERPGDPVTFTGVVEFRDLNMNLPVSLRDLSGELRIAEGVFTPELRIRGAIAGAQAVVFDRRLTEIGLNLSLDEHYLGLGNIDARFYRGAFRGNVEIHLTDPGAFRVSLRATDVALEEMLEEEMSRDERMTGRIDLGLDLESASGEVQDMVGKGVIYVREGRLFRVPGLRRILAVVGRATPLGGPRYKEASMDFLVDGERLEIRQIHLSTEVNDVYARGDATIYGDLDLVVEPQVAKFIDLPRLLNIPVLSTLRGLWHKTAYEIRLEGTIDSPALRLRALPWLKRSRRPYTQSAHAGRAERVRPRVLPR